MTADEQGPDTNPQHLPPEQAEVFRLIADLSAARTERDTALAERDRRDEMWLEAARAGLIWRAQSERQDERIDRLRRAVAAGRAAVVTARRDALSWATSCMAANGLDGHPAWLAVAQEAGNASVEAADLRARASTQTPAETGEES